MKHKYAILIAILILVSFLIRLAAINYEWIDVDEGNYLYDAKLLSEGQKPFEDFYMKEVFYTSILSVFGSEFGFSLMGARFLSILFSLLTIIFVYKIGKMLHGKRTGFIAAGIYALIPFSIFWNSLVRESVLQIMLMTISVYYIIKFTKTENFLNISLHAFFLFLAFLTRRSMALFVVAELVLLAYIFWPRSKMLLKILLYGLIGVAVPMALLIIYSYSINVDFFKILGFEFSPILQAFSWQQFLGQRALLPYWLLREAPYIIMPFAIALLFKTRERTRRALFVCFFLITLVSAAVFEYAVLKFPERMSQYPVPSNGFFIISIFYLLILFALAYSIIKKELIADRMDKFVVLWLLSIFAFYAFYSRFHIVYFAELVPAVVILIAPFLAKIYDNKSLLNRAFIVFLIIGVAMSSYFYFEYHGLNNKWQMEEANNVASFIKENTNEGDEIFTPMTFIPIIAERKLALNITHPLYYHFEGAGDYDIVGIPSFKTIENYLDRNNVRYVIADDYMDVTYYSLNDDLKKYIEENYDVEKKIGNIEILARKK